MTRKNPTVTKVATKHLLKIKPEDLETLKKALKPFDTPALRQKYIDGDFMNADKVVDMDKRYRWDLLYAAQQRVFVKALYEYMNDVNLDSALRVLVKPLKKEKP